MIHLSAISWGASHWFVPAVLVALAFCALVAWCYRGVRSLPGTHFAMTLKLIAIGILLVCLLEPLISGIRPRPGANLLVFLIDSSKSMQIEGRGLLGPDAMRSCLSDEEENLRTRLEQDFDVRVYRFDRDLEQLDSVDGLEFSGEASNLNAALQALAARFVDRPLAGVVLLTDGNATDASVDGETFETSEFPFPIYPVFSETEVQPRDLSLKNVSVSQTHFETSPSIVTADVVAQKMLGETLHVQLRSVDGKVVEEREIEAAADGIAVPVRFRFRPDDSGLSFYSLRVSTAADKASADFSTAETSQEVTLANNAATLMVNRGSGPYRILYVAGRPNWEFKFLRRALERDDEVQLIGLLRIAKKEPKFQFRDTSNANSNRLYRGFDGEDEEDVEAYDQPVLVRIGVADSQELAAGFPTTEDVLYEYDAVIVDDLEASFFSPDQMLLLRRYVAQRGGGLLMLGGVDTFAHGNYQKTPLGELLPVYLSDSETTPQANAAWQLRLTREGLLETWARLRTTEAEEQKRIEGMPTFETVSAVGRIKPGAIQVATLFDGEQDRPAIATQRFGRGRAAAFLLGDAWRWSLRRERTEDDDLALFWRQAIRWLVADVPRRAEIEVEPNATATEHKIVVTTRTVEFEPDDAAVVELKVTQPGDTEPIRITAEPSDERVGVYEASFAPRAAGGYRVEANVTAADGENLLPAEAGWVSAPAEREFQQLQVNSRRLLELAKRSKGTSVAPDRINQLVEILESRPAPVTEQWVAPLWHRGWVLGLTVFCLCGEWGIRRWRGMA